MPDMDPRAIDQRLRQIAELRTRFVDTAEGRRWMAEAVRRARQERVVDMSPAAVDRRLRETSGLRSLCLDLGSASD